MDHLWFLCLVFLMLSRLFIAALWLPVGKGLTSWLLLVMFIVFLLLSHMVFWVRCGTVVSFPDLCRLSYFYGYWGKALSIKKVVTHSSAWAMLTCICMLTLIKI